MTNKKGYQIVSQGPAATVYMYGGIDTPDNEGRIVYRDEFVDEVKSLDVSDITVRMSSIGGDPVAAASMYQALVDHPAKVTTVVESKAYSAGSMILQAGDKRLSLPMAMVMVHGPAAPRTMGRGTEKDHIEAAKIVKAHKEAMVPAYTRHGIPAETVIGWFESNEDNYFSAQEALKANLIDEIVDSLPMAASAPDEYKIAAIATISTTTRENPIMDPKDTLDTPVVSDPVEKHSRTVEAARAAGAKAEAKRRDVIEDVFAGFYTGDPLDSITAVYNACMDDVKCDELESRRKLQMCLAAKSADPILASSHYGMEQPSYSPPNASRHMGGAMQISRDAVDKRTDGITKALELRAGIVTDRKAHDAQRGNEFLSMSLVDLMGAELRASGYHVGGTRESIARDYIRSIPVLAAGTSHGTGHLANILADVANKSAMQGWDGSEETWSLWTQQGILNDYREAQRANLALLDKLDRMREHQEWEYGDLADVKQGIQGFFYGKKYGFSIQSIVNDDLGELTRAFGAWGEAASATVGDAVMALLTTSNTGYGQTMDEDSKALFHADHSNYIASGSGAAPSETTLNTAYVAMSTQTENSRTIGVRPRYILHGATLASTIWRQLNSENIQSGVTTGEPERNWVKSIGLAPVQDYRLDAVFSGLGWFLAASRRTIEVSGVAGPLVPSVERSMTSTTPGIEYEMSMPFGCAALDYRGFYFNYGA